jgi:hypothetical protein
MSKTREVVRRVSYVYLGVLLIPLGLAILLLFPLFLFGQMAPLEVMQSKNPFFLPIHIAIFVTGLAGHFGLFWGVPIALLVLVFTTPPKSTTELETAKNNVGRTR